MDTKQCLACKEAILADALKCKHCHQIQSKAANFSNKPIFSYFLMGFFVLFMVWIIYGVVTLTLAEPLEPQFEIDTPELLLTESDQGLNIRCIATIKNPSLRRWKNFSLQATFKNANQKIIDALYANPKVRLYPAFSFTGMVSGNGSALKDDYQSCELSVVDAREY